MKIQGKGFQEGPGTPYHVVVSSSASQFALEQAHTMV